LPEPRQSLELRCPSTNLDTEAQVRALGANSVVAFRLEIEQPRVSMPTRRSEGFAVVYS
jgi:hypothetical protein